MRTNDRKGCTPNAGAMRAAAGAFQCALRDTTTDHFIAIYKSGEAQPPSPPTPPESAP